MYIPRSWTLSSSKQRLLDHAQHPSVTSCRKVIWSSVKNQVALSTRWATWSWSNWDKLQRLFSVRLARSNVPEGLNMCECGVWIRHSHSTMERIRTAFAALKIPYYRASEIISRDKKSGHNPWQQDLRKKHGCKKRSTETRQIQLFDGPMAERRSVPRVSIGTRLDWRVGQVPQLHLQDWHQTWCTSPTATTIWKHRLHEKRPFQ